MITSSATRYALRSLRRHARRTLLSIVGLAFGVGVGLIALSWVGGQEPMSISAVAAGGIGHLRIAPSGWNDRRDDALRLTSPADLLAQIRATDGVAVATPRARVGGLLGLGTRSSHVPLTGVDAATEPQALRYVRAVREGRYLNVGEQGSIVLGRTIADRLRAELEDELVVTVVDANGEMQSALLVVIGIVETGSRAIDGSIAHVALADVEQLSGRPGAAEIAILVDDVSEIEAMRATLSRLVSEGAARGSDPAAAEAAADEVLTWLEISPEMRSRLESGRAFTNMAVVIVLFVVLLGVASAQLTGVLERRKEFAVLAALGMRGFQLVRVVVTEGVLLGTAGALAALAWTTPMLHGWAEDGVDLSAAMQSRDGVAFGGVLIDPIYHPAFGAWLVPTALGLSLVATILASLYPAWFASRTDPASALRVDR